MEPPTANGSPVPPPPPLYSDAAANGFSYSKFNSALNAGLLNPMSPPLYLEAATAKPASSTTRSSPTLFEMMANEQDGHYPRPPNPPSSHHSKHHHHHHHPPPPLPSLTLQERQLLLQDRVAEIMASCSPSNPLHHHHDSSDVRLTLSSKDGLSVTMNVHRQILIANSRFFSSKLSDHWSKQQRCLPHLVEISDCDDVEVYVETLRLMYSADPRRRLVSEDVPKVLSILKVCASIAFEDGVLACLEYLEAAPWAEDEEEKVAELLSQLQLESSIAVGEVLKRVCTDPMQEKVGSIGNGGESNKDTLGRLLHVVLEGKDEKARRDMKGLVSKMLRENHRNNDISRESLYSAYFSCLQQLRIHLEEVVAGNQKNSGLIARQADNIHWVLDILIERQLAEELLLDWAGQVVLAQMHAKIPLMYRYEISTVTARLFVGIGKGHVLVPKEARWLLLRTWLEPFYNDFGWMRRACKKLDRYSIEDGLASTVLTLPLALQQEVFLAWFDRFLNSGDELCPNLQKGFEVWWRRAFWRRRGEGGSDLERPQQPRVAMG